MQEKRFLHNDVLICIYLEKKVKRHTLGTHSLVELGFVTL